MNNNGLHPPALPEQWLVASSPHDPALSAGDPRIGRPAVISRPTGRRRIGPESVAEAATEIPTTATVTMIATNIFLPVMAPSLRLAPITVQV